MNAIENLRGRALAHSPHDVQEQLKQELYAPGLQARANRLNGIVRFEHTDDLVHLALHPDTLRVDGGVRCLRHLVFSIRPQSGGERATNTRIGDVEQEAIGATCPPTKTHDEVGLACLNHQNLRATAAKTIGSIEDGCLRQVEANVKAIDRQPCCQELVRHWARSGGRSTVGTLGA